MRIRPSGEKHYDLREIEALAARQLAEFRARLTRNGFELPQMPPVPVEYLALTVTEFSVRSVRNLQVEGRKLAGLLDPDSEEILYEATDIPGRQNFSIAHEIGHYFLHYLPQKERAALPSLFSPEELEAVSDSEPVRFFRCSENEVELQDENEPKAGGSLKSRLDDPAGQAKLAKILRFQAHRNRHEWEANTFAGALLMPPDLVRWLKTKHGDDLRRMAAELHVSQQALQYRLERLKENPDGSFSSSPRKPSNQSNPSSKQGTFF